MILTGVPIQNLIDRLGYGDDFQRIEIVEELIKRAKKGENISEAVPALSHAADHDPVEGVRNWAREALAEGERSARGENNLPRKIADVIDRRDWTTLERMMWDHHIGYEVRLILEGKNGYADLRDKFVRIADLHGIESLPQVLRGIVLMAQAREKGNPMTCPTGNGGVGVAKVKAR
ncbi:Uncharacterised protein [Candidatus Bilamarchaeum dharawalense]|uniref:Uncharacterized protein n=1 Tax=Candidatus Bilamarchaeum dharawalense TaxID=2885759 RepID=A0A5E4LPN6_9ARCH|nr:Uncharacterised protein [Candidatus Bilamarchaeum dharawalense]